MFIELFQGGGIRRQFVARCFDSWSRAQYFGVGQRVVELRDAGLALGNFRFNVSYFAIGIAAFLAGAG